MLGRLEGEIAHMRQEGFLAKVRMSALQRRLPRAQERLS